VFLHRSTHCRSPHSLRSEEETNIWCLAGPAAEAGAALHGWLQSCGLCCQASRPAIQNSLQEVVFVTAQSLRAMPTTVGCCCLLQTVSGQASAAVQTACGELDQPRHNKLTNSCRTTSRRVHTVILYPSLPACTSTTEPRACTASNRPFDITVKTFERCSPSRCCCQL
jgi:hypothetical protein